MPETDPKAAPRAEPTGALARLLDEINTDDFDSWYRERRATENIREGNAYRNTPSPPSNPKRHGPSSLLQCHRKLYYRNYNAPEETSDPHGIFWMGSRIEEDIVHPYLETVAARIDAYAANALWADVAVEIDSGTLRFAGVTDPVVVTREGEPLLVTEVKTKSSIDHLDGPDTHHRAQAHAYMLGLEAEYDRSVRDAIIIYIDRELLTIRPFHAPFDEQFWTETVLPWAEQLTEYRQSETLPPAEPEYGWECKFCSFRERCGEGDEPYSDVPPTGFLPGVQYPEENVRTHLDVHEDVELTPTLARANPDLAVDHAVADWDCPRCQTTIAWDAVDWDGPNDQPLCPTCIVDGHPIELVCHSIRR